MLFVMLEFFTSSYYFSLKFFYVDLLFFFKIFIEFITILLYFMSWLFGIEACGIPVPQPGIKPVPSALDGEVLTTGPPGKSLTTSSCFTILQCFPIRHQYFLYAASMPPDATHLLFCTLSH